MKFQIGKEIFHFDGNEVVSTIKPLCKQYKSLEDAVYGTAKAYCTYYNNSFSACLQAKNFKVLNV